MGKWVCLRLFAPPFDPSALSLLQHIINDPPINWTLILKIKLCCVYKSSFRSSEVLSRMKCFMILAQAAESGSNFFEIPHRYLLLASASPEKLDLIYLRTCNCGTRASGPSDKVQHRSKLLCKQPLKADCSAGSPSHHHSLFPFLLSQHSSL